MEEWRQSNEFPSYDISNEGRVRNRKTGRILKTSISETGRERVSLSESGVSKTKNIDRLVGDVYIPGYKEGMCITHKDGDILKSSSDNLQWKTRKEIAHNTYDNGRKQKHRMKPIRCIETGEAFESITDCSNKMNLSRRAINRSVNNSVSQTKEGYHFKPLNN